GLRCALALAALAIRAEAAREEIGDAEAHGGKCEDAEDVVAVAAGVEEHRLRREPAQCRLCAARARVRLEAPLLCAHEREHVAFPGAEAALLVEPPGAGIDRLLVVVPALHRKSTRLHS